MSVFKRKSTKKPIAIPAAVKISEEDKPLARSDFNVSKITEIQNRFQGGETLMAAGRIFVREGTLMKVCRKGPKPRHFFLFNDVLVYGTILSKGHYAQQHVLSLDQMSVSAECHYMPQVYSPDGDVDLHLDVENAFQINHREKSFHVFASSSTDKNNWLSNLKKYISKAQEGRETVQLVTRAVWVPDSCVNECMTCKKKFTTFNRKHHCRNCGKVVCRQCSSMKVDLLLFQGQTPQQGLERPERVCTECYSLVTKSSAGKPKDDVKQVTVIDSRPMHSNAQPLKRDSPERPPPPAAVALKQTSQALLACAEQTAERKALEKQTAAVAAVSAALPGTEDSGNETSDSDDSDTLEDGAREELKKTRSASLLSGSSWDGVIVRKSISQCPLGEDVNLEDINDDDDDDSKPQAPPRRKRQGKGQESPQTGRAAETETGHINVCAKCSIELAIGEFGFLEEQCYCRDHFKERYEELHPPDTNEQEETPKAKPRPVPRKQKESTEAMGETCEEPEDAVPTQVEEQTENGESHKEDQEQEEPVTSEPAKPARARKPNRFKKAEVKKEETSVREHMTDNQRTADLLGDEVELSAPASLELSAAPQAAVDDLLKMTDNDTLVPTEQLISLETDPSVLAMSHLPLIPSTTPQPDSPPQTKGRRRKTKFKSKTKDVVEKDQDQEADQPGL